MAAAKGVGMAAFMVFGGEVAGRIGGKVVAALGKGGAEEAVMLFHGSTKNASKILDAGLDLDRVGATYASTDIAAARNAIEYRLTNFPHEVTDPGIIASKVSRGAFEQLIKAGDIIERPYSGFYGSNLNSVEHLLTTPAARALFNGGIIR